MEKKDISVIELTANQVGAIGYRRGKINNLRNDLIIAERELRGFLIEIISGAGGDVSASWTISVDGNAITKDPPKEVPPPADPKKNEKPANPTK